jgi:hypothetical protein
MEGKDIDPEEVGFDEAMINNTPASIQCCLPFHVRG